jgi:hypothetical protein
MEDMGQVWDCIGLFGEDRIWILKRPWLAWLLEKAVTAACDPGCVKTCTDEKSLESFFLVSP